MSPHAASEPSRALPPPNAVAVTRNALPQLCSRTAALYNRLYRGTALHCGDLNWRWCPREPFVPCAQVDFALGEQCITALFDEDVPNPSHSVAGWRELDGALRTLAWTSAHETFLDIAQLATGCELSPSCVLGAADESRSAQTFLRAGFEVHDSCGSRRFSGVLLLPRREALRAARRVAFDAPRDAAPLPALLVPFRLEIEHCQIASAELGELTAGSLVRLRNTSLTQPDSAVVLTAAHTPACPIGGWRLAAQVGGTELHLREVPPPPPTGHRFAQGMNSMNAVTADTAVAEASDEALHDAQAALASVENGAPDIGGLPVTLQFCAGALQLPLAQVQTLGAGQVLPLQRRLEDSPIDIFANDVLIARGELVLIGDMLAVRVLRTPAPAQ